MEKQGANFEVANQSETTLEINELNSLELALVGGGTVEVNLV